MFSLNLFFPFVNRIVRVAGHNKNDDCIVIVVLMDSTKDCPIHGIALNKLVITVA